MGSPLPPDPYQALGVAKDATQAQIKSAHRKLVLKCHPDKVTDPAAKQLASDQFHRIQTSYEILVDEDRRQRYDAQVRLAELKKEAMERRSSGERPRAAETRPAPQKRATEPAPRATYAGRGPERPTPVYEERRPSYAYDYFDAQPRATARKEPEYERTSRRSAANEMPREKQRIFTRANKENEKERRREKDRKDARDTRRNRERKYGPYVEDDSESTSDGYSQDSRRMREEDEAKRKNAAYYKHAYEQSQQAKEGHLDEHTRKLAAAWGYIRSANAPKQRPEPERRPSPVRNNSSKDSVREFIKRKEGRPAVTMRRSSERPKTTTRDSDPRKSSGVREQESERRLSLDETPDPRKPPLFHHSKSSPAEIHIPTEKQRSQSLQHDDPVLDVPFRGIKRAETMPYQGSRKTESTAPLKSSNLRHTEFNDGLATPSTTPDNAEPAANHSTKYRYGRQQTYADDEEYPTPDGYRTELREPVDDTEHAAFTRRATRSPSPIKGAREPRDSRDKPRAASSRYPQTSPTRPSLQSSRTTSYKYTPGSGVESFERAGPRTGRNRSPQDIEGPLYGEVGYGRDTARGENPRPQRAYRPEDIKFRTGYGTKQSASDRPAFTRSASGTSYIRA